MGETEGRRRERICAVIVHHRGRRLLDRCLATLATTEGVALEVVVVANACHEELPPRVEAEAWIHVVRSERAIGFSDANNLGAAWAARHLAPCDAYFFVNNDTVLEAQTLARLAAGLRTSQRCAIVGPQLMIWGAEGVLNSLGLNVTRDGEAWDEGIGRAVGEYDAVESVIDVVAVTGAALLIRRDAFEELGGWSELYGFYYEDIDLCLRARSRGWSVQVVRTAVMSHAISATAARGSDMKRKLSWRNRFLIMLVHWPWGLLIRSGPGLAARECRLAVRRARARAWPDLRLQVRSWLGALRRWPAAFAERWRNGPDNSWASRLKPRGSVPVIELPEFPDEAVGVADGSG